MIKQFFSDYLYLSKGTYRGASVLLTIIAILIVCQAFVAYHQPNAEEADYTQFNTEIENFLKAQESSTQPDPQVVSKVAHIKSSNSGGASLNKKTLHTHGKTRALVDINTADSSELKAMIGIGPVLSKRIVKYRNLLGGFYAVDQLEEVYGVSAEVIERNKDHITLDISKVKKLDLDSTTFKLLLRHPYIDYDLAKQLIKYSDNQWKAGSIDTLFENIEIDSVTAQKLKPYITL